MRARAWLCHAVLVAAVVSGCSSAGSGASPADPASTGTTGTTGTTGPTDAAPSSTGPTDPEVVPAAGPTVVIDDIDTPVLRLHLPAEVSWRLDPGANGGGHADYPGGGTVDVAGGAVASVPGASLDRYAQITRSTYAVTEDGLKRLADRTVAGVDTYALESTADGLFYVVGGVHDDSHVFYSFTFPEDDARARAWIESVLASAEWL